MKTIWQTITTADAISVAAITPQIREISATDRMNESILCRLPLKNDGRPAILIAGRSVRSRRYLTDSAASISF
jgi:hypothetical protein